MYDNKDQRILSNMNFRKSATISKILKIKTIQHLNTSGNFRNKYSFFREWEGKTSIYMGLWPLDFKSYIGWAKEHKWTNFFFGHVYLKYLNYRLHVHVLWDGRGSFLRIQLTPANSYLTLTQTKIDFPWISVTHLL